MKLNVLSLAAAAMGLCFSACSNDGQDVDPDVTTPVEAGQPASLKLSISEPANTRADHGANATTEETAFYAADVFIYSNGTLETHKRLSVGDFSDQGDHVWATDDPILTTTGEKEIFVGLNMPQQLGADMAAKKLKGDALYLLSDVDTYPLISSSTGFVMFSTKVVTATLVPETINTVTIPVGRIVAKVTVQKGQNLNLVIEDEGKIDNLEFTIGNSNTRYWPFQRKSGSVVLDPNYYASEYVSSHFRQFSDYVDVDEFATAVKDREVKYTPENTSDRKYKQESTYATVRAAFIPKNFTDDQGQPQPNNKGNAVDFWTVRLNETGEVYYFDSQAGADTFADANDIITKYDGGYCYYSLYLNPTEDYQTYRNYFYQLRITNITGLGSSTPDEDGKKPEPIDNETNIKVVVDIQPWTLRSDDYELY